MSTQSDYIKNSDMSTQTDIPRKSEVSHPPAALSPMNVSHDSKFPQDELDELFNEINNYERYSSGNTGLNELSCTSLESVQLVGGRDPGPLL